MRRTIALLLKEEVPPMPERDGNEVMKGVMGLFPQLVNTIEVPLLMGAEVYGDDDILSLTYLELCHHVSTGFTEEIHPGCRFFICSGLN
jgi:hypothetical protein